MAQITGGELILRCLVQEKVKYIFAVPDAGYCVPTVRSTNANMWSQAIARAVSI